MPTVLFCHSPLEPRKVDPDFAAEQAAALDAGFSTALFDHTEAAEGDAAKAVRKVPEGLGPTVYRGWMLRAERYEALHGALASKGCTLVNDPAQYRFCHHLPESYAALEGHTPRSVWLPVHGEVDFAEVRALLRGFGAGPVIVKDYVKSQKHAWKEACFIPRADDVAAAERVIRRFVELQGEDLVGGLVLRDYVPLRLAGVHPKSGMPLAAELRSFWIDGTPLLVHDYWDRLGAVAERPPLDWMRDIATRVKSRFFTMDVALREDGGWTVIELGDGQVAGLPGPDLAGELYRGLRGSLPDERDGE